MKKAGFTLVEVVVALLVFELSVLAAVSTLTHAARVLTRAEELEVRAYALESTIDSLRLGRVPGAGLRTVGADTFTWSPGPGAGYRLLVRRGSWSDSVLVATDTGPWQ